MESIPGLHKRLKIRALHAAAAAGRTRKGKLTEISPAPRKQQQEDASQSRDGEKSSKEKAAGHTTEDTPQECQEVSIRKMEVSLLMLIGNG